MTEPKTKASFPIYIPPYCTPAFPSRDELHRTFGGKIYECDFEVATHVYMSDVDSRLKSDRKFDDCCARNIAGREFRKKYCKEGLH